MIDALAIDPMPIAQMCDSGATFAEYLRDFEFVKAFTCQYANTVGFATLGLVVYGAVASSIYIQTDSMILPFGLFLMIGGAALSQMAAVAVPIAVLLALVLPAAVTTYLYVRYSR